MELTDVASYLTDSLRRLPKGGQDENVHLRLSGRRRNTATGTKDGQGSANHIVVFFAYLATQGHMIG